MRILIIDNYDSFTYNLVQLIAQVAPAAQIKVCRNDQLTIHQLKYFKPSYIVISPGPGTPDHAGICCDVIQHVSGEIPVLGVCLGHQCIAAVYGAQIVPARRCLHGKTSLIHHDGKTIFQDIPNSLRAMRYHSFIVDENSLDRVFTITARSDTGEIMGIRHEKHMLEGIQFHPESFATEYGYHIMQNFFRAYKGIDKISSPILSGDMAVCPTVLTP